MNITAFKLASRFIGIKEIHGKIDNPQVMAMLRLDDEWPEHDEVPWCSAFVNYICWLLRLPRSKSLLARSWLNVGIPQTIDSAKVGYDVVVMKRGGGNQPGPSVVNAPGHVGFYAGGDTQNISVLAGNTSDQVCTSWYPTNRVLDIRRIYQDA